MWKYWRRMKGGTPSCVSVTIPQAHLHLALTYERDDIKTPALRVLKQSKTTPVKTYIFTTFLRASKREFMTNNAHRCLNRLLHRASCGPVVHLLPSDFSRASFSKVSHFEFRARAQGQSSTNRARASLNT